MDYFKNKEIARRSFVKTIVAVTAGCACYQQHSFAIADFGKISKQAKSDQNPGNKRRARGRMRHVLRVPAPRTSLHMAMMMRSKRLYWNCWSNLYQNQWSWKPRILFCDGCLGAGRIFPGCRSCATRSCSIAKQDVARCSDCPDFPCSRIIDKNKAGMYLPWMSFIILNRFVR